MTTASGGRDASTSVAALTARVRQFVAQRDWDQYHAPKDLAIGLAIEAAELLEHFRFLSDAQVEARLGDEARRRAVGHELADVLYFVLLMSANLGFDVTTILDEKLEISRRRYPVAQARGRNLKYTELAPETGEE